MASISSRVPAATMTTAAASRCSKANDTADFGDFVKTEDEELDLEEVAEPWTNYDVKIHPLVFYPICVGEVLNERYLIEHKVGSGGFSTVWMAHDLQEKRDVALKVMSLGEWAERETHMQHEIVQKVQDISHLVTYLATFLLPGKTCHHRVLVLPLMGPCLEYSIAIKLPMATRMSAARQLLSALESLHKAGIVHRDLNERNCMWGMVPLHHLSRSAKYELLGRPLKQKIPFVDLWKPGELVRPIAIPDSLRTDRFYLGDFGLAMDINDSGTQRGYPPMEFCSPDRLHGNNLSFACDMWSYMVIFARLYLGFTPFSTTLVGGIISGIIRCLGPLPASWKGRYTHPGGLESWYDQSKVVKTENNLASRIAYFRPDADETERGLVHSIMSRVFTYCPEERLTATQLLQNPSFRAIMDRYVLM